ncbi:hypothetical protein FOWG_18139, partial [Fusarium oxysporum f. sp. lycopersici MN25]
RMLTKDCENVPAKVKGKSPGHIINTIGLSRCDRVYSNSRTEFTDPHSQSEQTHKACQGAQWGVLLFLARVLSGFFNKQKAE